MISSRGGQLALFEYISSSLLVGRAITVRNLSSTDREEIRRSLGYFKYVHYNIEIYSVREIISRELFS